MPIQHELDDQVRDHVATVKTVAYSMSVNELAATYRDGELDLHPEFQRFFRWTPEQKSRFVESLVLGIPVPPIFVAERADAKWDVIDGLQRLATLFELMGNLRAEDGTRLSPLTLTKTHYLPAMEGCRWGGPDDDGLTLPEAVQIRIKRARLDVNVVSAGSDNDVQYEVFQRLNTGGSLATDQEVRNCLLVMANRDYFRWVKELADLPTFRSCLTLTDRALDEAFDMELVVRLLVFASKTPDQLRGIDELGAFLHREVRAQATDAMFAMDPIGQAFRKTFEYLSEHLGESSFRRYDAERSRYVGPMLVSLYEVVAVGLVGLIMDNRSLPDPTEFIGRHGELWAELAKQPYMGSGIRASTRIPETVAFGRRWART
jgi:hypothetical protein